jgi:hypothetical protein
MDAKFHHLYVDIDISQANFLQSVNIGEGALGFSGARSLILPPWLRACSHALVYGTTLHVFGLEPA